MLNLAERLPDVGAEERLKVWFPAHTVDGDEEVAERGEADPLALCYGDTLGVTAGDVSPGLVGSSVGGETGPATKLSTSEPVDGDCGGEFFPEHCEVPVCVAEEPADEYRGG